MGRELTEVGKWWKERKKKKVFLVYRNKCGTKNKKGWTHSNININ